MINRSAVLEMRSSLFWDVRQHRLVATVRLGLPDPSRWHLQVVPKRRLTTNPRCVELVRNLVAQGDARMGEVKGKLANGVGSQYSRAISERGVSSITQADAHTSAASSRLN